MELRPGGADIPVTNDNKLQYVHAMADYKLNRQVRVIPLIAVCLLIDLFPSFNDRISHSSSGSFECCLQFVASKKCSK